MTASDTGVGTRGEVMASHVLVVDDNPVNCRLLGAILKRAGYRLSTAVDGEEALKMAREGGPDLILLDVVMPGIDGFEVCERLKADHSTADAPVIFLSSLTESADKVRGLNLGAVDWVTKPFDRSEVLARVKTQLRIRHLTRSLREANDDLLAKQHSLREDLAAAADIQRSLIPRSAPIDAAIEVAWRFTPCESVGGDIFNLLPLDDDHVALYVVDVSGHGVPAAMVTVSVVQTLSIHAGVVMRPTASSGITVPWRVLELLDREYPFERFDRFFTMCYGVLNTRTGAFLYSSAAHPPPLLVRADGSLERLDRGGTIIGLDGPVPFERGRTRLRTGDRLFLYTDGIVEAENAQAEMFGDERLEQAVLEGHAHSLQAGCDDVMDAVFGFVGSDEARDDITLLGLEYRGDDRHLEDT